MIGVEVDGVIARSPPVFNVGAGDLAMLRVTVELTAGAPGPTPDAIRALRAARPDAPIVAIAIRPGVTAAQLIATIDAAVAAEAPVIMLEEYVEPSMAPLIRFGQPASVGELDKAIIRRVVRRHASDLLACYEAAMATEPELATTITAIFFITPHGTVPDASANGSPAGLAACVEQVIQRLAFPRPGGGGGVQVNYPFTFRPRH